MTGTLWALVALAGLAFGVVMLALKGGARMNRLDDQLRRADEAAQTRKRTDEAEIVGDDPDLARRWLHDYSADKR